MVQFGVLRRKAQLRMAGDVFALASPSPLHLAAFAFSPIHAVIAIGICTQLSTSILYGAPPLKLPLTHPRLFSGRPDLVCMWTNPRTCRKQLLGAIEVKQEASRPLLEDNLLVDTYQEEKMKKDSKLCRRVEVDVN